MYISLKFYILLYKTQEPWLIWGVFKFLFLHREEVDDDEYEIDVFDLSPNWSY